MILPLNLYSFLVTADDQIHSEASACGKILIFLSWCLVMLTMPFSLLVCFKVVQEYERAVIFRLGRLVQGGAKGPGRYSNVLDFVKLSLAVITISK